MRPSGTPHRRWPGTLTAGLAAVLLAGVAACGGDVAAPVDTATAAVTSTAATAAPRTATTTSDPITAPPLTSETISGSGDLETTTATTASVPPTSDPAPVTSQEPAPETTQAPTSSTPPPSSSTTTTTAVPVPRGDGSGRTVVIDPGHNGANGANPSVINAPVDAGFGQTKPCNTTGTSTDDGYAEHRFTWAVANRVADLLRAQGVTVVMTRDSDDGVGPCVNERARIGNTSGADAVVSIHGDGAAAGDRGFYAMTAERLPAGAAVGEASLALAGAVRDGLVAAGAEPSNYLGSDGLWQRADLAGLNLSEVPTTMLELGNMRDAQDAAFMTSDAGQDLLAAGIAQGVLDALAAG